jgi:hypothetical protein
MWFSQIIKKGSTIHDGKILGTNLSNTIKSKSKVKLRIK